MTSMPTKIFLENDEQGLISKKTLEKEIIAYGSHPAVVSQLLGELVAERLFGKREAFNMHIDFTSTIAPIRLSISLGDKRAQALSHNIFDAFKEALENMLLYNQLAN